MPDSIANLMKEFDSLVSAARAFFKDVAAETGWSMSL